jgi:hypothetical protein
MNSDPSDGNKSEEQREYERGQRDGSEASILDEMGHLATLGIPASEAYNRGWDHGNQNKSEQPEEKDKRED